MTKCGYVFLSFLTAFSLAATELEAPCFHVSFDDMTGAIHEIIPKSGNKQSLWSFLNEYRLLAKSGDRFSGELTDNAKILPSSEKWKIIYKCINPDLPEIEIIKRYRIADGLLEREIEFRSTALEPRFLQLFTSSRFFPDYRKNGYWFGAGYLGPYSPIPKVRSTRRVEEYKQSSKGMIFIHNDENLSFAHYRTRINDIPVWPWWNSTIGSYREKNDRLYYLPDGWKMCLGTFDLIPHSSGIRVSDKIGHFQGDIHTFFSKVYGKDSIVQNELASLNRPNCPWLNDLTATVHFGIDADLRYIAAMLDEGNFIITNTVTHQWADYRWKNGVRSTNGGYYTSTELNDFFSSFRKVTPRSKAFNYAITIAATEDSPIFREHPEYFRKLNRDGEMETHFPGLYANYQTRFQVPEIREFMVNQLFDNARRFGLDLVYLDEAQQQNTIDWEMGNAIRDDHLVEFFRAMRYRSAADGIPCFYNGSGLPYADINYIEALDQMKRENWRNFAGVAFGLELFSSLTPDTRIVPIPSSYDSSRNDYSNRVIALGWLPRYEYPAPLSTIRAAREVGKTFPIPLHYKPDWKHDFSVEVESYAVRRKDSSDVIASFINRKKYVTDLAIEVDLSSAGFDASQRINVWAMVTRHPSVTSREYWLANSEYRRQLQKFQWYDGFLSLPKLIYSGIPSGMLKYTFHQLAVDEMGQVVITESPVSILSINDLPANYFFTRSGTSVIHQARIISSSKKIELLLADKDYRFIDIGIDGKPASVFPIDIGGELFDKVVLPSGTHTLSYRRIVRQSMNKPETLSAVFNSEKRHIQVFGAPKDTLFALEKDSRTRLTSLSPLHLPEQYENGTWFIRPAGATGPLSPVKLTGGKSSAVDYEPLPVRPAKKSDRACDLHIKEFHITHASSEVIFRAPLRKLQEDLDSATASADPEKLRLTTRSTRREDTLDARFYAGFELSGTTLLSCRLTSGFFGQYSPLGPLHHVYGSGIPRIDFAGIIIDYRVRGRYVKRVAISCGIGGPELKNQYPSWGCGREFDQLLTLGDLVNKAPFTDFRLNLQKYAPADWDGTIFFSIGCTHVLPSRGFDLEILPEDKNSNLPILEALPLGKEAERRIPPPISLGRLMQSPTSVQMLNPARKIPTWSNLPPLMPLPQSGEQQVQPTYGVFAYDEHALYFVGEAVETKRDILSGNENPWDNDCLELYFARPGQGPLQFIIDASGKVVVLENGVPHSDISIEAGAKILHGRGFRIYIKIPWKMFGITEIYPGYTVKFNLARARRGKIRELSSCGPVKVLFNEVEHFSSFHIGKPERGTGKYDEFSLEP